MAWQISWINPQHEATYRALTLVLSHEELGTHRVDKIFIPSEMSEEELAAVAAQEIAIIESELQPVAPVATIEE
jgi:hypothetical protein